MGLTNDNKKRPQWQVIQLGVSKIYAFCRKNLEGSFGSRRERCCDYVSIFVYKPGKLILKSMFPLKIVATIIRVSRKGAVGVQ